MTTHQHTLADELTAEARERLRALGGRMREAAAKSVGEALHALAPGRSAGTVLWPEAPVAGSPRFRRRPPAQRMRTTWPQSTTHPQSKSPSAAPRASMPPAPALERSLAARPERSRGTLEGAAVRVPPGPSADVIAGQAIASPQGDRSPACPERSRRGRSPARSSAQRSDDCAARDWPDGRPAAGLPSLWAEARPREVHKEPWRVPVAPRGVEWTTVSEPLPAARKLRGTEPSPAVPGLPTAGAVVLPEVPAETPSSPPAPSAFSPGQPGFHAPPEQEGFGDDHRLMRLITDTVERSLAGATNRLNPGPRGADLRRTLHAGAEPRTTAERQAVS